jgi:hypothetical protein
MKKAYKLSTANFKLVKYSAKLPACGSWINSIILNYSFNTGWIWTMYRNCCVPASTTMFVSRPLTLLVSCLTKGVFCPCATTQIVYKTSHGLHEAGIESSSAGLNRMYPHHFYHLYFFCKAYAKVDQCRTMSKNTANTSRDYFRSFVCWLMKLTILKNQ